MPDPTAPSASERLAGRSGWAFDGFKGLHLVTHIVIVAGAIHLLGDVLLLVSTLNRARSLGQWPGAPLDSVSALLGAFGYSLTFFGTAATVEFLFRIWREVVLLRKAREGVNR
jgi:hypothetical protein